MERQTGEMTLQANKPGIAGHHQKLGEEHVTKSSLEPERKHDSAVTLVGGLWPSELGGNKFLLF